MYSEGIFLAGIPTGGDDMYLVSFFGTGIQQGGQVPLAAAEENVLLLDEGNPHLKNVPLANAARGLATPVLPTIR
jgi:hypothetical protein